MLQAAAMVSEFRSENCLDLRPSWPSLELDPKGWTLDSLDSLDHD